MRCASLGMTTRLTNELDTHVRGSLCMWLKGLTQRLEQIVDQIVRMFETDGHAE